MPNYYPPGVNCHNDPARDPTKEDLKYWGYEPEPEPELDLNPSRPIPDLMTILKESLGEI